MTKPTWLKSVGAFAFWLLVCALGFWVFVMVRHALSSGMSVLYVAGSIPRGWRSGAWDRLYIIAAGLGYLVFIFAIQWYLEDGVPKQDLLRRVARVAGIELLIIFLSDLFTLAISQALFGQTSFILLFAELLLGGGLLFYSLRADAEK